MSTLAGVAGSLPLPGIATIADPGSPVTSEDQAVTAQQLLNQDATLEAQINGTRRTLMLGEVDLTDADHILSDAVTGGKQRIRMLTAPAGNRTIKLPQPSAWAGTTAYSTSGPDFVSNDGGKLYQCVTSGTSAGSGGPTGTGSGIVDGSAHWDYVGLAPVTGDWCGITVYVATSSFSVQVKRSTSSEYLAFLGPAPTGEATPPSTPTASVIVRYNGTKWKALDFGGRCSYFGDESSDP